MTITKYRIKIWHRKWSAYLILNIYGDKTISSSKAAAWFTSSEDIANEMLRRCKEEKMEYYDPETGKLDDTKWFIETETEEV